MKAKKIPPLLVEVSKKIGTMDERDAFTKLISSGCSIALATKLVANKYRVGGLRDETKDQFKKFLSLGAS